MRKIQIKTWKAAGLQGEEVEDNFINVIKVAVNSIPPNQTLRGLDHFRTFNRLSKAIEKAEKEGSLILEETEYIFVKESILKHIPATLGMNPNISEAVEDFINAKAE